MEIKFSEQKSQYKIILKHFLNGSILYLTNSICQRKGQKGEAIQRGQNLSKFEMIADSMSILNLLAAIGFSML